MAPIPVHFEYLTGLARPHIRNAKLSGNWDETGQPSARWSSTPMTPFTAEDGCPAFRATVMLDDSRINQQVRWGVTVDTPQSPNLWGIPTEVGDTGSTERTRSFVLRGADQRERYYLTHCRRLGANKLVREGQAAPAIRFAVWAPNARDVALVIGGRDGGYIWNDGSGITRILPMHRGDDAVWETRVEDDASLADFAGLDHMPYMYRIVKEGQPDGAFAYRTDLYSRCQIGSGGTNPESPGVQWSGRRQNLDGSKSCSVVIDPDQVCELFRELDGNGQPVWPEQRWLAEAAFWQDEFSEDRPLPTRLADLVIYELHVDGLGLDHGVPEGTLEDALRLLDHLVDLGVNCIQLMPMSEFQDRIGWGYSTSHYLAIEYSGGGRDQFKHFVRECHRRGIAVILDVVYNHYTFDAERAEWAYDSDTPEHNIYYWYEGRATDYARFDGGYIDNGSSGWGPRFWEEMVRKLLISSAAALVSEFHFDGFRVDLTTALHRDAVRHADGRPVAAANLFGQKFLREWSRTLKLLNPSVFLIAEDHSHWPAVTQTPDAGGLGFDATWYVDYYHHLIGDAQNDPSRARLMKIAGYGDDRALAMTWFAGTLADIGTDQVIYHESHDEAGNSYYMEGENRVYSGRTIAVAVNNAPLVGDTRRFAEERVRFAAGVTLLARGIPMFFMGEEIGASHPYRYADFINAREDFPTLRQGVGAALFRFYQDVIRLRLSRPALRSDNIEIVHVHDSNRVLAFRRWQGAEDLIVVATLNNHPFADGYRIASNRIADGQWREVLNSDDSRYGGTGLLNTAPLASAGGALTPRLAVNSVILLQRQ